MEPTELEEVDANCVCAVGKRHWGKGKRRGVRNLEWGCQGCQQSCCTVSRCNIDAAAVPSGEPDDVGYFGLDGFEYGICRNALENAHIRWKYDIVSSDAARF